MRSSRDASGHLRYCYIDEYGHQGPTLRLHPGDLLILSLINRIQMPGSSPAAAANKRVARRDPCAPADMGKFSTNLHFHGMVLPVRCHQDETMKAFVNPGDPPFEYRVRIPRDHPAGLYWYHPHFHGLTEEQILGGASGAIVIEGLEHAVPRVAGLPERILVIRDEPMPAAASATPDRSRPTKQISINSIPVLYPDYRPAVIQMEPKQPQLWRVLNASADTFMDLSVEYGGKRQVLGIVAFDGVALQRGGPGGENYRLDVEHSLVPPGGRLEFIVTGPDEGTSGLLRTEAVNRGSDDYVPPPPTPGVRSAVRVGLDDIDPARPLATIVASQEHPARRLAGTPETGAPESREPLSATRPIRKRTLYFSEKPVDPSDPNTRTLFFITLDGHTPAMFDPNAPPDIVVHQGDVEDWIIENRSQENHTFHIHQLHFLFLGGRGGVGWQEPTLRDTINLPAWDGFRQYPSVTLRMDFRDPAIVGVFPFHCHILQHVDGGMLGTVQVLPANK